MKMNGGQRAFEHALAQQRLEGLVLPIEAERDLRRLAQGEMTMEEALRAARARFGDAKIRQS